MVNYLGTFRGTIGADEIFTHTLAFTSSITDLQALTTALEDAFAEGMTAGDTNFSSMLGADVQYSTFGAAEILDLNLGTLASAFHNVADIAYSGSGVSGAYQMACALSYEAGTYSNGTPVKGRTYLPATGSGAAQDGRFTASKITGVADFATALLEGMASRDLHPCVWSRKLGELQGITDVVVGDVPDTIRSRRNSLRETYTAIPVTL